MICLGIGNQFQYKLGATLKDLYHTGDPNIPSCFVLDTNKTFSD